MTTKLLLLLVPLAACASQVDSNHQGDVIATMHGSLTSARTSPLPSPEVSLVWLKPSEMSRISGAEHVEAQGLVSQFTLSVYSPPPDDILESNAILENRPIGMGLVVVGSTTTDFTDETQWRGADLDHMLLYFPEAPPADSVLTAFLHGAAAPTAGFHLYTVTRLTEAEQQQRLDCLNALPHEGMSLDWARIFRECRGAGNDELDPAPADLDTLLDASVIEDGAIVQLINDMPHPLGI
ncbi:MAG TPA: hypothetical protein VIV58_20285 [Kofleriaceae bacterium]